jgi:hypothetical protein
MHVSTGLFNGIGRKPSSSLANRKLDFVTRKLGANIYHLQYYSQHDGFDLWDPPFFIKPNLQLDPEITYHKYQDGRIDCLVNLTNKEPVGFWKWFRKGRGTAKHCQAVLTLTNKEGKQDKYWLIWLIVYEGISNPAHIDLDPSVTRQIIFAAVYPKSEQRKETEIYIPTGPSIDANHWNGAILKHGEHDVEIRITHSGPSVPRNYSKVKFPDDALNTTSS